MSKTKEQLEEENEALRDLIKAVQQCADVPLPAESTGREGADAYERLLARRARHIANWLRGQHDADAVQLRSTAALFRDKIVPVTYATEAQDEGAPEEGTS